ncbi:MAG TPA: hypothetical protein VKK79_07590 [Candidatus Lokiarchaeia archaeon]|nr:hypothetical protein [Candidatus Lokiarchaeia archaeon]
MKDNKKNANRDNKGHDDDDKVSKDRSDIAERWNPFTWMKDLEQHFEDEFKHFGFGRWMGGDGEDDMDAGHVAKDEPFTKQPADKSSGWSYHFQTGMEGPEIRTWGDTKPEDIEKFLADQGGFPALGPSAGSEDGDAEGGETAPADDAEGQGWNPFNMFRDIFEGFSRPFFKNMQQALGSRDSAEPIEFDASDIEPTVETPPVPEPEEVTQAASDVVPQQAPGKEGKPIVEPFTDVFYDADGNLVGTLETPGATEDTIRIALQGRVIRIEAEGPLRKYAKEIEVDFKPDPAKVTCQITNGICELRAAKA